MMAAHDLEPPTDFDFLLIGKTGTGKSALGNSILRWRRFASGSNAGSATSEIDYEITEYMGKRIKVVDGPGVGDTRLETRDPVNFLARSLEKALVINPRGYHAFLLTFPYGSRYNQDTVAFLKGVFGDDFVRNFCILVLTYGDNFEREAEEEFITLDQWCSRQDGHFKNLLEECNNRVVLFNNITRERSKQHAQIDNLLTVVERMHVQQYRYRNVNFDRAREASDQMRAEGTKPFSLEQILQATSLTIQRLGEVITNFNQEDQTESLKELLETSNGLTEDMRIEGFKGKIDLSALRVSVTEMRESVGEAFRDLCILAVEKSRKEVGETEERKVMGQEILRRGEEFAEKMAQQRATENERRAMEREMEVNRQEMEERLRREREANEQERTAELERMKTILNERFLELERVYKETKEKSDIGWLRTIGRYLLVVSVAPIYGLTRNGREWLKDVLDF